MDDSPRSPGLQLELEAGAGRLFLLPPRSAWPRIKADDGNATAAVVNHTVVWEGVGIPALLSIPGYVLAFCEPGGGWPVQYGGIVVRRTPASDLSQWGNTSVAARGSNPAPT